MLERLQDVPVAVFDASWPLLDHNDLWGALHGHSRSRTGRSANLVWQYFIGAPTRVRHPFPDEFEQSLVADLRDVVTRYPGDQLLADLVEALRAMNPTFAELGKRSTVSHHSNEHKTIDHPAVGEITLDCDVPSVHGSDLRVVVFTPAPDSEAAHKLSLLAVIGLEDMGSHESDSSSHV